MQEIMQEIGVQEYWEIIDELNENSFGQPLDVVENLRVYAQTKNDSFLEPNTENVIKNYIQRLINQELI